VIWTILGHSWLAKESESSPCRTENDGIVVTAVLLNLIAMWIYLGGGLIVFIFTLIIVACDEGR